MGKNLKKLVYSPSGVTSSMNGVSEQVTNLPNWVSSMVISLLNVASFLITNLLNGVF